MRRLLAVLPLALIASLSPASALAAEPGVHSDNMSYVKNIPYPAKNGGTANYGTDIEFATLAGRQYALAGSYENGMQIVDITRPGERADRRHLRLRRHAGGRPGLPAGLKPGRTFAGYASDTFGDGTSTCYREAAALGFDVRQRRRHRQERHVHRRAHQPAGAEDRLVRGRRAGHPQPHDPPERQLPLQLELGPHHLDPARDRDLRHLELRDAAQGQGARAADAAGARHESHDITFNTAGDRAYSAALSQGVIINTTNPARPTIVSSFLDPTINVWHQMDPFTMTDAQGNQREFLIAEDEVAGAIGTGQCPNGGVHVYDITGDKELSPEKVGYWNIDDIRPTANVTDSCTAHVFDIHEREQMMTIAYYNGGVHVVDLSGLTGISLGDSTQVGGPGMREIGYYRTENGDGAGNADTWSFKAPKVEPDRRLLPLRQRHRARARRLQVLQRAGPLAAGGALADAGRGADRPRRRGRRSRVSAETAFFCLLPRLADTLSGG